MSYREIRDEAESLEDLQLLPDQDINTHASDYKTFLLLNLTTSPLSTLQRAYIPAILQSQLYETTTSPESLILQLRSLGSFFSLLTMPLVFYITPSHLLRSIILIFSLCSISFILPAVIPNLPYWILTTAYVVMITFTALYESSLSSIIPGLIRKGEVPKEVSAKSMIFSDIGALFVLILGFLCALIGISLNLCVFAIGIIVLIMSFKVKGLESEKLRRLEWRRDILMICLAWAFWNCGMVNFMIVVNMRFRKMFIQNDSAYTGFMIWSFISAALGTWIWMKIGSTNKKWIYGLSIFTIIIHCYVIFGIFNWNSLGLKYTAEFWTIECLYIATSSSFRSLNRAVYSEKLPKGEESQFFGLEIMLGIFGNWIMGGLSSLIKQNYEKDGYVIIISLVTSLISLVLYNQCDIE